MKRSLLALPCRQRLNLRVCGDEKLPKLIQNQPDKISTRILAGMKRRQESVEYFRQRLNPRIGGDEKMEAEAIMSDTACLNLRVCGDEKFVDDPDARYTHVLTRALAGWKA